jgi:hypothetical protein
MIYRLVANTVEDWAPQVGTATSILFILNNVEHNINLLQYEPLLLPTLIPRPIGLIFRSYGSQLCRVGILSPAMGRGIDSRNRVWNWVAKLHRLAGRYANPMPPWFLAPIAGLKGTQEWELFWLRFWILYYFIVSYAQILRFCKKIFWSGHHWGRFDYSA